MTILEQFIKQKNTSALFRIGVHICFWLFYWLIGYYFNSISLNLFSGTALVWQEPLFNVLNLIVFYYPFMYLVWPALLKKRRYIPGLLLILIQILLFTLLHELEERLLISTCKACSAILEQLPAEVKQNTTEPLAEGIVGSLFSFGILYVIIARLSPVIAIKVAFDFIRERSAAIELEKENLILEFNFLKSQVNPHFLFNTLNNIHSLVVQDRKQDASVTIAKLSDFLRHSLYESGSETISISKEIKLIEDYIELEKLRLNKTVVNFTINTDNPDIQLPPLLFIPLVENAFKYTADNLPGNSFIDISLSLIDRKIECRISNNFDPKKRNNHGGIGLRNLKKRLQNYYPDKHQVNITETGNIFNIQISIEI